ncbi:unnamed protein product, partial [Rotaria sp. Silwood1]
MIPGEDESILLPATQFKVLSNTMHWEHENLHEITLEEIETISDVISYPFSTIVRLISQQKFTPSKIVAVSN